jgi:hypothetical protein
MKMPIEIGRWGRISHRKKYLFVAMALVMSFIIYSLVKVLI